MSDSQRALKAWLRARLKARGLGSCAALAAHLGLTAEAVTRMKSEDGAKEQRRIEAHLIPSIAGFFGEWPPGFEHMDETKIMDDAAAELVDKAKKARRKKSRGKAKAMSPAAGNATRDLVVEGIAGEITVIDKSVDNSINVVGDAASISGNGPASLPDGAAELMGDINEAISQVYRSMKRNLSMAELGKVALERHAAIMAACQDPEEYPHAIAIMTLRLQRKLRDEAA